MTEKKKITLKGARGAYVPEAVTKYLVVPEGGRVGKSRQVQQATIEVEARPHDLKKIGSKIVSTFHKYFKRYDAWVQWTTPAGGTELVGVLYCNGVENKLATFVVEQIEE